MRRRAYESLVRSHPLSHAGAAAPARIVLLDRAITYGMLALGMEAAARRLVTLKLEASAPVAIAVESPLRQTVLALALMRIGVPSLSAERMSAVPADIAFAAVLGDPEAGKQAPLGSRFVAVGDDWFAPGPADRSSLPEGFTAVRQVCRLSLTSGTTGASKLFRDTVADIGARAYHNYFGGIDLSRTGVLCMPGLSTTFGFGNACATLAAGRPLCFAGSAGEALAMIELYSIDFVIASTEQVLSLAATARRTGAQLRSLRNVIVGGSVPSRTLLEAAMSYLCKDILCQYGATEIGLVARTMARDVLTRPGLVGLAVPGVEVGVFDTAGQACAPEHPGIIKVDRRAAYEDAPTGPRRTPDWIPLGDDGWLDADGRLYVVGRSSERTASSHVSPEVEVEHILRRIRLRRRCRRDARPRTGSGAAEHRNWCGGQSVDQG